jgi:hypothetical protein
LIVSGRQPIRRVHTNSELFCRLPEDPLSGFKRLFNSGLPAR